MFDDVIGIGLVQQDWKKNYACFTIVYKTD